MDEAIINHHHLHYEKYHAEQFTESDFLQFVGFVPNDNYHLLVKFKEEYEPGIQAALVTIQKTISRWKMLDGPLIEERGDWVMMTIGGVWRLAKRQGHRDLFLWEYCILERRWRMLSYEESVRRGRNYWFQRSDWPVIKCIRWGEDWRSPFDEQVLASIHYVVCKLGLAGELRADENSGHVWKLKQLKSAYNELMVHYRNGAKESRQDIYAIRKALWRHFLDRDLMSVLCTKNFGHEVLLSSYIRAIRSAAHLFRIARESRNVLPLLNVIPEHLWPRDDLLKDDTLRECPALAGLSNSALRWLRRAPCGILCKLYYHKALPQTIEVLSGLNLGRTVPVIVQRRIVQRCWGLEGFEHVPTEVIRLFRLFAAHCLEIRDTKGWKAMKRFLRCRSHMSKVLDWFWAEVLNRSLPDKNSTWASLVRQSDRWHDQFRPDGPDGVDLSALPLVTWDSPLPETTIDDVVVRPLDSNHALIQEGQTMQHCVSAYVPQCLKGYRVFSLTDPDGTRSTLGFRPSRDGWQLDQHYGVGNSRVSAVSAQAAKHLLLMCNSAEGNS